MELKNKVVVITGGTKGIGKALALLFKKNNANVIICSKTDDEFEDVLKEGILAVKADVTIEGDLNNLLNIVINKYGHLDLWINNAGIWLPYSSIEDTDWERAHELMEVNLFGTIYGSKVALIEMRKQGFGMIMNILSVRALGGIAGASAYCASKYAANGFTQSLIKEVEGTNIKVISVYPEKIKTNLFDEKRPSNYDEYMDSNIAASEIIENLKKEPPLEKLIVKR
jgi:3-oxoacyl-[acyl-carrier protein] reductase